MAPDSHLHLRVGTRQSPRLHAAGKKRSVTEAFAKAESKVPPSLAALRRRTPQPKPTPKPTGKATPGHNRWTKLAYPKKRPLTVPVSPNLSKPRVSTVRKPYQPKIETPQRPRATPAPAPKKKRGLTIPVSPKLSKPRVPARAAPVRQPQPQPAAKPTRAPLKRTLTRPVSPNFTKRPTRRASERLSATTKELMEIEEKKKEIMMERKKYQEYHRATQGIRSVDANQPKSKFTMILRSAGVIGVPAIRRPKLTTFKEFHFLTDKRALDKQDKEEKQKPSTPKFKKFHFDHLPPLPKRRRTIE